MNPAMKAKPAMWARSCDEQYCAFEFHYFSLHINFHILRWCASIFAFSEHNRPIALYNDNQDDWEIESG
jgi:hypothetical protein